jgi:hypothetical protein
MAFEFFRHGGRIAWGLIAGVIVLSGVSVLLVTHTAEARYERDVTRMVFNHTLETLDDVKKSVGASNDTLEAVLASADEAPGDRPYIVVSIAENRLWYKQGNQTLFTTRVATGSGKELDHEGGGSHWKFDTPRGRLVVQGKEADPVWVPPDWHYVEMAKKKHLGLMRLQRGQEIPAGDGSTITVDGNDVVQKYPDGRVVPMEVATEGKEIAAGGNIIIPPYGTNQRKYKGVLGTYRLEMGDGYGIHGTDTPSSIGRSASHGCVRLRNEDIETLYRMVPVGTPVFIY